MNAILAHLMEDLGDGGLAIRTESLGKRFGRDTALRGLNLRVPEGSVTLLVGPNGAGKSTTLRVLMGLLRADEGTASVFSLDPMRRGAEVRARVGYVPERWDVGYGWMRVGRMLEHHAAFFPGWDAGYAARLAEAMELRMDRKLGALSKGQARRVQLLLALAHRPPLLLLDEPTDGLDPVVRDETLRLIAGHLADSPTTALISTHRVYEVERLADRVAVLGEGRLLAQISCDRLRRKLQRYRAEVPEAWTGAGDLDGVVVRRAGTGREILWTVWGEPDEVTGRLARAGATVREVGPLSLDDAAITLLGSKEDR